MSESITKEFPQVWAVRPGFFGQGAPQLEWSLLPRSDVDLYSYEDNDDVEIVELDEEEKIALVLSGEVDGWSKLVQGIEDKIIAVAANTYQDGVQVCLHGSILPNLPNSCQYSPNELIDLGEFIELEDNPESQAVAQFCIEEMHMVVEFFKNIRGVTTYSLVEICENGMDVYYFALDDPSDLEFVHSRWEQWLIEKNYFVKE